MSGRIVHFVAESGAALRSEQDAVDLISDAAGTRAEWMAIPASRFHPDFWDLKTRVAGLFLQKLRNYNFRIAIIGDIAEHVAKSKPLADWVRESNRGDTLWFLPDQEALEDRLGED